MILFLAAASAMPLPPPGQIVQGFGTIPESRSGPVFPWKKEVVPAVAWNCRATMQAKRELELSGVFSEISVVPSSSPSPSWPPYGIVTLAPNPTHQFDGQFLATYSRNIYGFRYAYEGNAYEITVRFPEVGKPGLVELRQFTPGTDKDWREIGRGKCSTMIPRNEASKKR